MRAFCNTVLAVLVISALFWGNCFSCPQLLQAAKHACCPHNGKTTAACQTQVLRNFVKAETQAPAPPAAVEFAVTIPPAPAFEPQAAVPVSIGHAPPDPLTLHSSFRI